MNIDELKLILDLISQMGQQGKEAFIWWVILDNIPTFLIWSGVVGAIFYSVRACYKFNMYNGDMFLTEVRDLLGVGSDGNLSRWERTEVIRIVRELALEHRTR